MGATVSTLGEVRLIERMRRRLGANPSVVRGIGDDAAVVRAPRGGLLLFASDMLVEGVHFHRRRLPAYGIGWKALACNISDIAAMGGVPRWAVVSLGLPPKTPVAFVDGVYAGLQRCARAFTMAVVGGDTVRAPCVVVGVAIVGTVQPSHLTLRGGVKVGDGLYVTGRLGGSYRSGHHATFRPRLREAQTLVHRMRLHAMMDLSDGLTSDLWQMSRASHVGLRIEATRVPVSRASRSLRQALMEGEDFELLFAVSPTCASRVPRRIGACPITRIGTATARGVSVEIAYPNGRIAPLVHTGFHHF